ncbi:MAG: hypothetical protein WCK07_09045 [Betaproteobacteria bacterium]
MNINGTPAFVIGQQLISGAAGVEGLKAAVNAARQALAKKYVLHRRVLGHRRKKIRAGVRSSQDYQKGAFFPFMFMHEPRLCCVFTKINNC